MSTSGIALALSESLPDSPEPSRQALEQAAGWFAVLDSGEATSDVYRFLSPEVRERCTRLLPGPMILDQPMIPAPIPFKFPFPNYATRADEVADMSEEAIEDAF